MEDHNSQQRCTHQEARHRTLAHSCNGLDLLVTIAKCLQSSNSDHLQSQKKGRSLLTTIFRNDVPSDAESFVHPIVQRSPNCSLPRVSVARVYSPNRRPSGLREAIKRCYTLVIGFATCELRTTSSSGRRRASHNPFISTSGAEISGLAINEVDEARIAHHHIVRGT
jgi:hypothetical protein